MKRTTRPFTGHTANPITGIPVEQIGGDAYAVAFALPKEAPEPSITEQALDGLPANHREEARRQIAAYGADGFFNPETMMGVEGADPTVSNRFTLGRIVDFSTLESMYRDDGAARKEIEIPVHQVFRKTFTLKGETDGKTVTYLKKKGILHALEVLAINGGLFGGALGIMLVDDGAVDLAEPLNLDNVQALQGINVFDRWQVAWYTDTLVKDPENQRFMKPEKYQIFPIYGQPFWVHHTRCLRWDGAFLTERQRQMNMGWHDSELQALVQKMAQAAESFGYARNIVRTLVIETLKMKGLAAMIAAKKKDEIQMRMQTLRKWRSVLGIIPVDADDDYKKDGSSIQGLPALLDRFLQILCADGRVPYSIKYGKLVGGISGGKDEDVQLRMFYDMIRHEQQYKLEPNLVTVIDVAHHAKDGPYSGSAPEDFTIEFPPLTEPTALETAQERYYIAQADAIYLGAGGGAQVFTVEEIAELRGGGDTYTPGYKLMFSRTRPTGIPDPVLPTPVAKPGAPGAAAAAVKKKPEAPGGNGTPAPGAKAKPAAKKKPVTP